MKSFVLKYFLRNISKRNTRYIIDFLSFSCGYFIYTFIGFLIIIITNKSLSPDELGKVSYYKSIIELLASILTLTLYQSYLRFNIDGVSLRLLKMVSFNSKISLILLGIFIFFLTSSILPVFYSFYILFNERLYFFRSLMKMKNLNIIRISSILITLCFLILYFNLNIQRVNAYNIVLFSYGIGYAIALFYFKNNYKINDDILTISMRDIFKYTIPGLGLILIDWFLNLSSQYFLKEFFNFTEVAKFAVAQRGVLFLKIISGLLLMFYPTLYFREMKYKNIKLIKIVRWLMVFIMIIFTILFYLFSTNIYIFMGAQKYLEYSYLFKILIIAECIYTISGFWSIYLAFALQPNKSLFIYFVGAILNCLIVLLFLKEYGIIVSAISILISSCIIMILSILFSFIPETKYLKKDNER